MEVVIFPDHLYLTKVIIKNEKIVQGEVINGAWLYRVNGEVTEAAYLHDPSIVVNKYAYTEPAKIVYVPPEKATFDYNAVIHWASNQEGYTGSLEDLADLAEIDLINLKRKHDEFDDDIPF
jgi:hypothetical protein